jgi:hypothetical protein
MSKTITLLKGHAQVAPASEVGLLFECAPDGQAKRNFPGAMSLAELIGDFDTVKSQAFALATRLLEKEPPLRGLRQLTIFDELVIRELQTILHAKILHDRLASNGVGTCVFAQPSSLAQYVAWLTERLGTSIDVAVPDSAVHHSVSALKRSWGRLRAAQFTSDSICSEWRQVMDRLDPFHRRGRFRRNKTPSLRRPWFYSTAYTFSRIGLIYERHFRESFEYLVEDPRTGGAPLAAIGRSFSSPYDFVTSGMAPKSPEVVEARETIRTHLQSVELSSDDAVVRDAYLDSPGLATFIRQLLPHGLFQTELFKEFVRVAEPTALVVGNPVFEGYALHAAQQAQIPTCLLQHGILGDFCQFVDPPVDHYIVRGEFWREFLAPKARSRSVVLNPKEPAFEPVSTRNPKRSVVFLTAPYRPQEFWDESDREEILSTLLAACEHGDAELVIRVHPTEQIGTYESLTQRVTPNDMPRVAVTYSQGPGLDDLLGRAAVAVTFSSTAFLDCLRYRVPIVSFSWHDFSYKHQLEEYGVFHFCHDLAGLRRLIRLALQGELPEYSASVAPFLADSSSVEIERTLEWLLGPRSAAA